MLVKPLSQSEDTGAGYTREDCSQVLVGNCLTQNTAHSHWFNYTEWMNGWSTQRLYINIWMKSKCRMQIKTLCRGFVRVESVGVKEDRMWHNHILKVYKNVLDVLTMNTTFQSCDGRNVKHSRNGRNTTFILTRGSGCDPVYTTFMIFMYLTQSDLLLIRLSRVDKAGLLECPKAVWILSWQHWDLNQQNGASHIP